MAGNGARGSTQYTSITKIAISTQCRVDIIIILLCNQILISTSRTYSALQLSTSVLV